MLSVSPILVAKETMPFNLGLLLLHGHYSITSTNYYSTFGTHSHITHNST